MTPDNSKGLSGGVGDGQGHWRLELDSTLDIEPLAYARSADGSLSGVHDAVASRSMRHHVLTFNPGSNLTKRSLLRLVNPSGLDTDVVITGLDDAGAAPPGGEVRLTLPADEARTLSAQALEAGGDGFEGRFGDGAGKWQVFVNAGRPIQVMSLLSSPGNLVNLSAGPSDDTIRGGPGGDELWGSNGDDVFDPGTSGVSNDLDADRGFDTVHGSRGDDTIDYSGSGAEAYQEIRYSDLDTGITATIDGAANRATVAKGAAGTDTIVDVAAPLNTVGFDLHGTRSDDVFHLTLDDGQFMDVAGEAGNDTFNVRLNGGWVRATYIDAPDGVNVSLRTGRAHDDGHGDVDTFTGDIPRGIAGSEFSDVLRGSDRDESFIGRRGNDTIDGGGGFDRLRLDRSGVANLNVDLSEGVATGTWNGEAFTYRISNIEEVRGSSGDDELIGDAGNNTLRGRAGDDVLQGGAGDDRLYGGSGDDVFIFERGHGEDSIADFTNGDDVILLRGLGLTKADVLANAGAWSEGTGTWIDLTGHGGGRIDLQGFDFANLDETDFLL